MRCPKCGRLDDKVVDSRSSREGSTIRRRRQCLGCNHRFTTYEEIEHEGLMVVKRDGRREEFSKEKLLSGVRKACQKRPVSPKIIEDLVEKIVDEITDKYDHEVPSMSIGAFRRRPISCKRSGNWRSKHDSTAPQMSDVSNGRRRSHSVLRRARLGR